MSAALAMPELLDEEDAPLPWERIGITRFASLRAPQGKREALSWFDLCRAFMRPMVLADKHAAPLWSPATFKGDHRAKSNVEVAACLGLDFDELPPALPGDVMQGLGAVYEALSGYQALIVTSYSHTLAAPRGRALIPFSRPVSVEEYEKLAVAMMALCERAGLPPDTACKDASRAWYVPSVASSNAPFRAMTTNADGPIDVERALANVRKQERPKVLTAPVRFSGAGAVERCRKYVAKMDAAISGAHGHDATFKVALAIVQKFDLSASDEWAVMTEYNARCQPPWSDKDLKRKLDEARKAKR